MEQIAYRMDAVSVWKTVKGLLIVAGGLAVTYILQEITKLNFGEWTAPVAGLCMVLINFIRQFIIGIPEIK